MAFFTVNALEPLRVRNILDVLVAFNAFGVRVNSGGVLLLVDRQVEFAEYIWRLDSGREGFVRDLYIVGQLFLGHLENVWVMALDAAFIG
jgi:hypothetical protein